MKKLDKINWNGILFNFLINLKMNIYDKSVLENLNKFIAIYRLNKSQILQMVNLVSLSNDMKELKDNLKWENFNSLN